MTKTTIVLIELGMLGGIVTAGYLLPGNTPLRTFLLVSAVLFVVGNIYLISVARTASAKSASTSGETGPWPHIRRAFGILAIGGLVTLLFLSLRK